MRRMKKPFHVIFRSYGIIIAMMILGAVSSAIAVPLNDIYTSRSRQLSVEEAETLLKQGMTEAGRKILRDFIKRNPKSTQAYLLLGRSYLLEKPFKTLVYARDALEQDAESEEALNLLSAAYGRMRAQGFSHSEEATLREEEIEDYQRILETNPDSPGALYRSASHRLALQRLIPERTEEIDIAVSELERLITVLKEKEKFDDLDSAYHQLGRAYKHQADVFLVTGGENDKAERTYELAMEQFRRALELDENRVDSLGEIILIYRSLSAPVQAVEIVQSYLPKITHEKAQAKTYEMLGTLYVESGDSDRAIETFHKGLELDDALLGTYLYLAHLYSKEGKINQTEEILKTSVEIEPSFLGGYTRLGQLYMENSQPQAAIQSFEKLLQIRPSTAVVLGMVPSKNLFRNQLYYQAASSLAWLYQEQGKYKKALEAVQKAKRYQEPDPHLMDTLGWIYYKMGNNEKALEILRSVTETSEGFPAVHYHLAKIYFKKGDLNDSKREVEKALQSGEEFQGHFNAKALKKQIEAKLSQ